MDPHLTDERYALKFSMTVTSYKKARQRMEVFIRNLAKGLGPTLPSTGGIGTTIFYVAGSILVLAAAILLITKRRMGAND